MANRTSIEWTRDPKTGEKGASWNPLRGTAGNWHCVRVSPGCDNCYAATFNARLGGPDYAKGADTYRLHEPAFVELARWRKPRRVFVCSMCDLFEQAVPDHWIERIFDSMVASQHTFQVLTKRPDRMRRFYRRYLGGRPVNRAYEHIWLGTTIESDDYTWRADVLRDTPAAVRWISAEPLLGPLPSLDLTGIHWVVTGGESGRGHRPFGPAWAIDLRDRCRERGIAFFHKQAGGLYPGKDRLLDGQLYEEYPDE